MDSNFGMSVGIKECTIMSSFYFNFYLEKQNINNFNRKKSCIFFLKCSMKCASEESGLVQPFLANL
jgi:hypothetical protein